MLTYFCTVSLYISDKKQIFVKAFINLNDFAVKWRTQGILDTNVTSLYTALLAQMIPSYLTAMKSFIPQLYNNSFHMTSGLAINKIKSKRKDLIKENDIKSTIESGEKYQYPMQFFFVRQSITRY